MKTENSSQAHVNEKFQMEMQSGKKKKKYQNLTINSSV